MRRAAVPTLWFLGIAAFTYYTIEANPLAAGIAAIAAAAIIGVNIYLENRGFYKNERATHRTQTRTRRIRDRGRQQH
jgi:hypothetical protein